MVALVVESWIWWTLAILVAGSRYVARRIALGSFRAYQADDYLMMVVLCFYTTIIATINIVRNTSSNLLPPGYDVAKLTKHDIAEREYGSKLILVVEQSQCVTVWGAKLCLVLLYLRLTALRRVHLVIKILAVYIVVSFIVMDTLYFGVWCRPFHEYWAVPTTSPQCDAATNHLITNAVFNLSSDCIMLAVGLPMFLRMNLPLHKKVPLVLVFSLGLFVVLAAILNKVYSFTDPFGSEWTYWYVRESSTAILVANLPFVWTFWGRLCGLRRFEPKLEQELIEAGPKGFDDSLEKVFADSDTQRIRGAHIWVSSDEIVSPAPHRTDSGYISSPSRKGSRLTLGDVLAESGSTFAASSRRDTNPEPNAITHPMLFYARKSSKSSPQELQSDELPLRGTSLNGISSVFPSRLNSLGC